MKDFRIPLGGYTLYLGFQKSNSQIYPFILNYRSALLEKNNETFQLSGKSHHKQKETVSYAKF